MYTVVFDEEAIGRLEKLPAKTKERIFKKIIAAKANPFRCFERLAGRGDYKLRSGDYRVIADISPEDVNCDDGSSCIVSSFKMC